MNYNTYRVCEEYAAKCGHMPALCLSLSCVIVGNYGIIQCSGLGALARRLRGSLGELMRTAKIRVEYGLADWARVRGSLGVDINLEVGT